MKNYKYTVIFADETIGIVHTVDHYSAFILVSAKKIEKGENPAVLSVWCEELKKTWTTTPDRINKLFRVI